MITIIIGTNRPGSVTAKVARTIAGLYTELGETPAVLDLQQIPAGAFSPAAYDEDPPGWAEFIRPVLESDGLVVVVPEYNGSVPGALKYFIDLLPFPESFDKRPVCFVGLASGQWGALRPVEHLQGVFGYRNAFIHPVRVFLPGIKKLLDGEGRFVDPEIVARLRRQAESFLAFTRAVKPLR